MKQLSKLMGFVLLCLLLIMTAPNRHVFADDALDYLSVTGPCNLVFPEDHGLHAGYRTEWWYYTGNLQSDSGKQYGFQLTFFRNQISAPGAENKWPEPHSAWRTQQVFAGHAAISDIVRQRHVQSELIARGSLGIAGVSQHDNQTTIFIKKWSTRISADRHFLKAVADDFSFELSLHPAKPPVLHGQGGYSLKGLTPERASCYYSQTRLRSEGALTLKGVRIPVQGMSWMDHEFSSAPLESDIVGWDWFSLQLSDNTEIMVYLLRKPSGEPHQASSGTFIEPSGRSRHLTRDEITVEVLDRWKSPKSPAVYPARWRLIIFPLAIDLTIAPKLADQEMQTQASTGVTYWEGSVAASGSVAEQPVKAEGFVELTGYAGPFDAPM
jgi:predicted secreted hydrolase